MTVWDDLVGQHRVIEALRAAAGGHGMSHAWLFTGPPGSGRSNAAVAFAVRVVEGATPKWYDSDRGQREFRVARGGCFRGGVPVPAGAGAPDAVRFRAYSLPPKEGQPPRPASVRLTRVNRVFVLGEDYAPRPSTYSWVGSQILPVDGDWQQPK